jgi:hypothetical protein
MAHNPGFCWLCRESVNEAVQSCDVVTCPMCEVWIGKDGSKPRADMLGSPIAGTVSAILAGVVAIRELTDAVYELRDAVDRID